MIDSKWVDGSCAGACALKRSVRSVNAARLSNDDIGISRAALRGAHGILVCDAHSTCAANAGMDAGRDAGGRAMQEQLPRAVAEEAP